MDALIDEGLELHPEPPAHPAVEKEVESRVKDKEDVVEMGHTDEVGRDAVPTLPDNMRDKGRY